MFLVRRPIEVISTGYKWYILRVEGSYEKKTSLALHFYGTSGAIPPYELIRRLWVPEITTQFISKDGSTKERRTSMIPGYLFIETILSYRLYAALKKPEFPHVFGWLQNWQCWPAMVSQADIRRLATLEAEEPESPELSFGIGDKVAVPTLNITGVVLGITTREVTLDVEIFQQKLPFKVKRDFFGEIVKVE